MGEQFDVSVVICTYNRCDSLPGALESILAQETGGVRYEIIVVDNNSTDRTREVIESLIARNSSANMRYVFEGKQGLSNARNTGIEQARAPIITFTDDDVRAERDWVANIKRTFDEHPEVDFVGGKVLPQWDRQPPSWLTDKHWAPLAITDHGDKPVYVNREKPWCLVGANLSFRREVFERFGLFTPDFQRVKNGIGSTEDHELQLRLWLAGRQGLYAPDVVVTAEVQADRLTKDYHRRWYTGHGKFCAMMSLYEIFDEEGRLVGPRPSSALLFGMPAYIYRGLLTSSRQWVGATVRRDESSSFEYEAAVREWISYIRKRYEQNAAERKHSALTEVVTFAKGLFFKKASNDMTPKNEN